MDTENQKIRKSLQEYLLRGRGIECFGTVFRPGNLPIVHFKGSRIERAVAAGRFSRPFARRILNVIFRWVMQGIMQEIGATDIHPMFRSNAQTLCMILAAGVSRHCFWPRLPHDLKQELIHMCRAAGINYGYSAFICLLAEFEMLIHYHRGCSAIAVGAPIADKNQLFMGRNLDFDSMGLADVNHLVQVHHPVDGKEIPFASIGWLGFWGTLTGWNKAGLSLACTVVYNGKKDDQPSFISLKRGIPMAWAYNRILRGASNVSSALSMLRKMTPMAPNNIILADSNGQAVVVEWAPKRMTCRTMENGILIATNGFRNEAMFDVPDDCYRYANTVNSIRFFQSGSYTADSMRRQLDAVNQGELTLHSAIFEPMKGRVQIAINPPPSTRGTWHDIDWDIWKSMRS